MDDLVNDLSAVVARHANTLTPHDWLEACQRVMLGLFPEDECPTLLHADVLLEALRRGVKAHKQSQEAAEKA